MVSRWPLFNAGQQICNRNHTTGSRECQDRLKKARDLRGKANGDNNGGGRGSRRRSRDDRGKKPRWFSSEEETSRSRSRSRASRSRSRSRSRSFPPLPPLAIKGAGQLQQQQQKKKTKKEPTRKSGGVKVSWGAENPWFAPHSGGVANEKNNTNSHREQPRQEDAEKIALRRELELSRAKQKELERQIAELTKAVRDLRSNSPAQPQTVQTRAPWQAGNEDFATFKAEIQQMMQQMMQQQQQQMQQVQLQVTELRSSIRKQKFTENIREKAYHRPALASLADTSANNTEA
ncbi:arginine and glutamate-rich protein 1-like [Dermacentor albipictus]|uniref:arginine and glutamate-rich protein 1-like n=1 Tax=Dermacentor albipictus TaxID=60249 RepID=UPI0038FC4158